ncbi:hypothetical protein GCM10009680_56760 [Streptomyces yatensis]|uniref:Uncharacterized protein n=1 Tax=Streptomyces yatensis TaxID=155177 RepID=A0ABN2INH6_9ACTN
MQAVWESCAPATVIASGAISSIGVVTTVPTTNKDLFTNADRSQDGEHVACPATEMGVRENAALATPYE